MKQIITRYTLSRFLMIFMAVLLTLTAIILLFDLVELLRQAAKRENIAFFDVLTLALLKSPQMMHIIFPFVVLISGMIFFLLLNRSSELIVMRAVGMSAWNVLIPLGVLVFCLGLLDIMAFSPISSSTARRYERLEERIGMKSSSPFKWTEDGFWWREITENGTLVIRASQVNQKEGQISLENVSVLDLSQADLYRKHIESQKAYLNQGELLLTQAFVVDPETEKAEIKEKISFETTLSLERLLEKFDEPQTMSFWRFPHFIRFLKHAGFSVRQHEVYFFELTAFPLFLVAMLLISALFTLPPSNRRGGVFLRVLAVLGTGFGLYFFSRITNVMGLNGSLPLFLAAWGPALIAIPICISCLLHFEDG
ncbi:MAG: LptF/LptG family permease [Alphaproteobacteria bacterium]|nr:LptF/LptG family permease [Alphaproteobacteria bacterium]